MPRPHFPDFYVPDGKAPADALARTTHLAIAAHPDDLEIMAYHGIAECYGRRDRWFTGVVLTDGAGSPRAGRYARVSDARMREIRRREQRGAARIGRYAAVVQLGLSSTAIRRRLDARTLRDLTTLLRIARPGVVYLHNPADRHATHVAAFRHGLAALRSLPSSCRPARVYGCEVWRSLDWVPERSRVALDVSRHPSLASRLLRVFRSQIAGGKRYDLATLGRRRANATFAEARSTDRMTHAILALELSDLVRGRSLEPDRYLAGLAARFAANLRAPSLSTRGRV